MKYLNEFRNTNKFSLLGGNIKDMAKIVEYFENKRNGDVVGIGCDDVDGTNTETARPEYVVRVDYKNKLIDYRVFVSVPTLSDPEVRIIEQDVIAEWDNKMPKLD